MLENKCTCRVIYNSTIVSNKYVTLHIQQYLCKFAIFSFQAYTINQHYIQKVPAGVHDAYIGNETVCRMILFRTLHFEEPKVQDDWLARRASATF